MRLDDYDPGDDIRDLGRGSGGGFGGGGGGGLGGLLIGFLPMLLGRKMGCGTILLIGAAAFFLLGPGANMLSSGGGTAVTRWSGWGAARICARRCTLCSRSG